MTWQKRKHWWLDVRLASVWLSCNVSPFCVGPRCLRFSSRHNWSIIIFVWLAADTLTLSSSLFLSHTYTRKYKPIHYSFCSGSRQRTSLTTVRELLEVWEMTKSFPALSLFSSGSVCQILMYSILTSIKNKDKRKRSQDKLLLFHLILRLQGDFPA